MKRRDFIKFGVCSVVLLAVPKFAFGASPETVFEKRFARGEAIISESFDFNRGIVLRGKGCVKGCYFNFTHMKDNVASIYFPDSLKFYKDKFFTQNIISFGNFRGPWPGPDAWR